MTQRVQQGRQLVYNDYIGPVRTPDEAQLFNSIVTEQQKQSGTQKVDWVSGP